MSYPRRIHGEQLQKRGNISKAFLEHIWTVLFELPWILQTKSNSPIDSFLTRPVEVQATSPSSQQLPGYEEEQTRAWGLNITPKSHKNYQKSFDFIL